MTHTNRPEMSLGRLNALLRICRRLSPLLIATILVQPAVVRSAIYEVGPGMKYRNIANVPMDSLEPGDIVKIHRKNEPYHEKLIIRRSGTEEKPIIIQGVSTEGKLPIIDGNNAIQFQREEWNHSGRWLIKVGDSRPADNVTIENLHLRNANNTQLFAEQGAILSYQANAAGVFVAFGKRVAINKCIIHSCGNGVQTSYGPNVSHVTLNGCWISGNGNHRDPSSSQEHNVYLCGANSVVQFCRFGEPRSDGHNIKDRGHDTVIRYNWIEGGKNRQLDLVDYKEYKRANAYVYGNVIIQGDIVHNKNMIHWGGDSGHSRSGILYLFNNTIVAKDANTLFLAIRYSDCAIEIKNNVFVGIGRFWNGKGRLWGSNNWFSSLINGVSTSLGLKESFPQFCTIQNIPYMPCPSSSLINAGTDKIPKPVEYMPNSNAGGFRRPTYRRMDIGAYELPNSRGR